jgi:NADPH:quinone reductase-like Zn-dependent oxidoreductase
MKAIIWTCYGPPDVLQLKEVGKPVPKDNEVRVKIQATTVTAGDCEMRSLKFPVYLALPMRLYAGFIRPSRVTILGQEVAGVIEAVGGAVKRFREGDAVFGITDFSFGAYAEYASLPVSAALAIKPANLKFEEAAAVPLGGLDSLHFLRKANLQPGQKILIIGAGGSIGTFGVQLARYFGAQVTAIDSTEKLDMLMSIGAEHVIDYTREDFTQNGETYDVIFDVVGIGSLSRKIKSLKQNGWYLLANPGLAQIIGGRQRTMSGGRKVYVEAAGHRAEDLIYLKDLIEAGKIKPVIDRSYPLEQTADAHRYVESGQKKGNVVIKVF